VSTARPYVAPQADDRQGSHPEELSPADCIRAHLGRRHRKWDLTRPGVLALAADALAAAHACLVGRVARIEQLRRAKYLREALRGEKALAVEDLALLALDEPEGLAALLDVLGRAAGYRLVPEGQSAPPLRQAIADALRETGDAFATIEEALADNRIDRKEAQGVARECDEAMERLARIKAAVLREARHACR